MSDWIATSAAAGIDLTPWEIGFRLGLATVAGFVVAAIGYLSHGHRKSDAPMLLSTLVLLTVLIAMVTMVIGNSVARAFGLVGALSIVRFRTVVDDTRDTAFVIFAVIVGMAIGAGTYMVPVVGIPLVGIAAILLDRSRLNRQQQRHSHQLTIRLGAGRDPLTLLSEILDRYVATRTTTGTSTARQGAALDLTFAVTINPSEVEDVLPKLVAELNRIEGVQSVELVQR
ncbi:DUF4956 domain-containing protein [Schlesneria paludicola]|uniref:DUF4956 domain-containing protein n=1 Tax=Schlesneria paludicola TaxID=360056 RepID=UPI00029AD1DC|nr:DUF4956 domain-containing protein [Schlesneria paludicola]